MTYKRRGLTKEELNRLAEARDIIHELYLTGDMAAVPFMLQQCIDAKTSDGKPLVEGLPFTPTRVWLCKFILKHGRFPRVHLKSNYEPQWRENLELYCVYKGDKNRYFSGACWFDECILAPGETMEV